jgi:hypothetical protein
MSIRGVFVVAFLTVVLIFAGAFAIPEYFPYELLKCSIYVVIAMMVFFGENTYSYMLGIVAPIVGMVCNILLGGFFSEFSVLWASVTMKPLPIMDTPLPRVGHPDRGPARHPLPAGLAEGSYRPVLRQGIRRFPGGLSRVRGNPRGLVRVRDRPHRSIAVSSGRVA